jgi:putative ABC transport system permease protein
MTWLRLSINQWRRKPLRAAATAAGVAIAVTGFCSLLAFCRGYQSGIRLELNRLGAHVLLVPKGCPYDAASMALHGASWPCYLRQEYLAEARSVPGVASAAPVFMAAIYETNATQAVYLGVDTNILSLKTTWQIQGSFPSLEGALLIGSDIQKRYSWQIGARVALPGLRGQYGTVAGILAPTHGAEDAFIYLRLGDAQKLFHRTNELTHILVRLNDPDQLENAVSQLRGCDAGLAMNVVPLTHLFKTIQSMVDSTRLLLGTIALIALLIAGTGVTNTILMAVAERTREIGVMRALGASRVDVFRLIWLEALQLCLAGALSGIAAAALFAPAVEAWARTKLPFVPTDPLVRWDWQVAAISAALALVLGTVAAFLPAWRAAQLMPMVAMRNNEACS